MSADKARAAAKVLEFGVVAREPSLHWEQLLAATALTLQDVDCRCAACAFLRALNDAAKGAMR